MNINYIINKLKQRFFGVSIWQIVVLLVFVVMLFFFGDSSLLKKRKYEKEIKNLKTQIEYYKIQTKQDSTNLEELQSNRDNLEKFARENYHMKRKNEEVFIID